MTHGWVTWHSSFRQDSRMYISAARLSFERNMHCLECFGADAAGSNKETCVSFVWCRQVCIYLTPLPHSRVQEEKMSIYSHAKKNVSLFAANFSALPGQLKTAWK